MKTYIHKFRKWNFNSSCKVHIKKEGDITFIGFEDIGDGTSVTNASEDIATEIVAKEGLDPEKCRFFEFYPEFGGEVDEISYTWKSGKAISPKWKRFCDADKNPFIE